MVKKNIIGIIVLHVMVCTIVLCMRGDNRQEKIQWQTIKNRVRMLQELKKTSKQTNHTTAPQNFKSQTSIYLKRMFHTESEQEALEKAVIEFTHSKDFTNQQLVAHAQIIIDAEKRTPFYVFYHGQSGSLAIIDDILQELYGWLNIESPHEKTKFLRLLFSDHKEFKNVDQFLRSVDNLLARKKGMFDWDPEVTKNLLPANTSLFANSRFLGAESSWAYYTAGVSINPPKIELLLSDFFDDLGFNTQYVQEIIGLYNREYLQKVKDINGTMPGILFQLFIAPSIVDMLTYLSRNGGYPYILPDISKNEVKSNIYVAESAKYIPGINKRTIEERLRLALEKKITTLRNAIFDKKLERFSVAKYLELFRNDPKAIPYLTFDSAQVRIYLKYSDFIDPEKVQLIKYIFYPDTEKLMIIERSYKQKLAVIIEDIIKDWLFTKTKKDTSRLERLNNYLKEALQQ